MSVVKKIFDGVFDDEVHGAFLKFGRGGYRNKYLLEGKRQSKNWGVKAGAEYVNFLVRRCLEKINGRVAVKGVIVSTLDLKNEISFDIVKVGNFQGIRKNVIDSEVEASEILKLMDKFPRVFFALSFGGGDFILKIKAKAPKNGKPGNGDDKPVVDFCSLKTGDKLLVDDLFFGAGNFNEVSVNHTIEVREIIYPENADELKPEEVRELSKRKGIVIRNVLVDGVSKEWRAEFVA
ncbi:MAG: hypothetical protein V1889_03415 [archaeon]